MIRKCIVIGVTALSLLGCSDLETGVDELKVGINQDTSKDSSIMSKEEFEARIEMLYEKSRQERIREYKEAFASGDLQNMSNSYYREHIMLEGLFDQPEKTYFERHPIHEQLINLYAEIDKLKVTNDYPKADDINSTVFLIQSAINQLHSSLLEIPEIRKRGAELVVDNEQ